MEVKVNPYQSSENGKKVINVVRFEAFMVVKTEVVFWVVTLHSEDGGSMDL
jgi:hypothetical protein